MLRMLPLVLVLALGACGGKKPVENPSDQRVEIQRFLQSEYTYCDAVFLAAYWGQDVEQTKARIGRKVGWGDQKVLDGMRSEAFDQGRDNKVTCGFYDAGFTYEDAEALAVYWGVQEYEAKGMIENKISWGNEAYAWDEVKYAHEKMAGGDGYGTMDEFSAFADSRYTYCDARILAESWGGDDVYGAKKFIGLKIINGNEGYLEEELGRGRAQVLPAGFTCQFYELDYDYNDAEALSRFWGVDVSEAKDRIAQKYAAGNLQIVNDLVRDLSGG